MNQLLELYRYAEQEHIDVDFCPMSAAEALSLPLSDGSYAIAIDPGKLHGTSDEVWKLAHELGHCQTGSFYSSHTPLDERVRCEIRATRWAIEHLLPFPALSAAAASGITSPADLAEHFTLPQSFVEQAIAYYTGPCGLHL